MLRWIRNVLACARLRQSAARSSSLQARIDGWMREGYACHGAGDLAKARQIYGRILQHAPDNADALYLLGEIAQISGNNEAAIRNIGQAISVNAGEPRFHYGLGCALQATGDWQAAAQSYGKALSLAPSFAEAHNNLGSILHDRGESDQAIAHFRAALEAAPDFVAAYVNLGFAMQQRRELGEALRNYDRALAINPQDPEAHFNKSLVLLSQGRFLEGWQEYEWRWLSPAAPPKPDFAQPEWDGSPLAGRSILIFAEQGYGDAIQFVRYAPLVAARGGRVIISCEPALKRVLESVAGVSRVLASGEGLPEFDVQLPLLSLPRMFATTVDTIPAQVPYVRAQDALAEKWRAAMSGGGHGPKIGLVWASQPLHRIAPLKSATLAAFAPLGLVADARFYSLQKGEAGKEASAPGAPMRITDLSGRIEDFADTAAFIANLDLTISVDTAVAHLAGAMGKPVWTLLPHAPDWRWHPDQDSSAWYPTMRLYKQDRPGDWTTVISRLASDLLAMRFA